MQKDERDLLEVLKSELEFVEQRGYQRSPEKLRGGRNIFSKTLLVALITIPMRTRVPAQTVR